MLAAIGAAGAAYKYSIDHRTERWERMTQKAVDSSEEAVNLIHENTELTKKIQVQGDGTQEKLNRLTAASSFARGHLEGAAEERNRQEQDDLDRADSDFLKKEADMIKKKTDGI